MNYTEDQLTPWFPAHVKPSRNGLYMKLCGYGRDIGFQFWDGEFWYGWSFSLRGAMSFYQMEVKALDNRRNQWRGLNFDPAKKGKRK